MNAALLALAEAVGDLHDDVIEVAIEHDGAHRLRNRVQVSCAGCEFPDARYRVSCIQAGAETERSECDTATSVGPRVSDAAFHPLTNNHDAQIVVTQVRPGGDEHEYLSVVVVSCRSD